MAKLSHLNIERCFSIVADSNEFLELDFLSIKSILASSELLVDSELQVYDAAKKWLRHKSVERGRHAKDLLLKVRLTLLSTSVLNSILKEKSGFAMNDECVRVVKNVLNNKSANSSNNATSRYCSQDSFDIIVCAGLQLPSRNVLNDSFTVKSSAFSHLKKMPQLKESRRSHRAVCVKNEIYIFGGVDENGETLKSVEKYSPVADVWTKVADMIDGRDRFCCCSLMDKVYLIGGSVNAFKTDSCVEFETETNTFKEVAGINEARSVASASVFNGKIVVSGGNNNDYETLKSVEAYDHVARAWTRMPDLVEMRSGHKSIGVKNKLFVFESCRSSAEAFDSVCNKFVLIKVPKQIASSFRSVVGVVAVGSKIFIFGNRGCVTTFDRNKKEWAQTCCEATKKTLWFSCAKIPLL